MAQIDLFVSISHAGSQSLFYLALCLWVLIVSLVMGRKANRAKLQILLIPEGFSDPKVSLDDADPILKPDSSVLFN